MKIGILTHQYINNYGAFLQAWALREAISELFPEDEVQIIDEEYPSYDEKQGLSNGKGVSCILVNTNQGKATLEQCEGQFVLMTSDFEKVARHNDQLHSPSKYSPKREQILELYQKEGYEAVDRYFHKNYKKDILKYTVSGMLPKGLKRNIKKMAGKIKNK